MTKLLVHFVTSPTITIHLINKPRHHNPLTSLTYSTHAPSNSIRKLPTRNKVSLFVKCKFFPRTLSVVTILVPLVEVQRPKKLFHFLLHGFFWRCRSSISMLICKFSLLMLFFLLFDGKFLSWFSAECRALSSSRSKSLMRKWRTYVERIERLIEKLGMD